MDVEFLSCGDAGLSVQFGDQIERSLNERVVQVNRAIEQAGIRGVVETVPSFRAILIHYDPLQISQVCLVRKIEPLLTQPTVRPLQGKYWTIPACYDPEFAVDLEAVARSTNLSPDRIVEVHTSTLHYVYMIGFAPGQPHMGDLPKELAVARRRDPRTNIEKGSVVIASGLTIIYPFANPSGWHIIGRSPISVFDIDREPPTLLRPGDYVTFTSVSTKEFREISQMVDVGGYQLDQKAATTSRSAEPRIVSGEWNFNSER